MKNFASNSVSESFEKARKRELLGDGYNESVEIFGMWREARVQAVKLAYIFRLGISSVQAVDGPEFRVPPCRFRPGGSTV
jgi:hypothetical protein